MQTPSQRQRAAAARRMETPQRSPTKRLEEIQAALDSQVSQAAPTSQPRNSQHNATLTNDRTPSFLFGSSTQSSVASTDVDWEDMLPDISHIEPSGSYTNPNHPAPGSSDFRTPKEPRISPTEPSSDAQAPHNFLMTPPQTIHRHVGTSSSQGASRTEFPSTPTRNNKGKERAREQIREDDVCFDSVLHAQIEGLI
jgi:hypothetical protein